jgi:hypothetical protein
MRLLMYCAMCPVGTVPLLRPYKEIWRENKNQPLVGNYRVTAHWAVRVWLQRAYEKPDCPVSEVAPCYCCNISKMLYWIDKVKYMLVFEPRVARYPPAVNRRPVGKLNMATSTTAVQNKRVQWLGEGGFGFICNMKFTPQSVFWVAIDAACAVWRWASKIRAFRGM